MLFKLTIDLNNIEFGYGHLLYFIKWPKFVGYKKKGKCPSTKWWFLTEKKSRFQAIIYQNQA